MGGEKYPFWGGISGKFYEKGARRGQHFLKKIWGGGKVGGILTIKWYLVGKFQYFSNFPTKHAISTYYYFLGGIF